MKPSGVLDHATGEITIGNRLGINAAKKLPGKGFKRAWPPLIKMDAAVKAKVPSANYFRPQCGCGPSISACAPDFGYTPLALFPFSKCASPNE